MLAVTDYSYGDRFVSTRGVIFKTNGKIHRSIHLLLLQAVLLQACTHCGGAKGARIAGVVPAPLRRRSIRPNVRPLYLLP